MIGFPLLVVKIFSATARLSGPDILTIPIPDFVIPDDIAAMVSFILKAPLPERPLFSDKQQASAGSF